MAGDTVNLRSLLTYTRDGEWGRDHPDHGLVPMRVIRGTDFEAVRWGDLTAVPTRHIRAEHSVRKALKSGDILIETAGGSKGRPTGRTLLIRSRLLASTDIPFTCASFARFIRVDETRIDAAYLFWYLQHLYRIGEMEMHQVQHTGVARFQFTRFAEEIEIPLPPLPQQRAIAHVLGVLDDKIELNRRMNETLEAITHALFKSWFVDFDPVRAKMEGRDAGIPQPLADLFPVQLVDSIVGEVPADWKILPLDDVANFLNGLALQKFPPPDLSGSLPVIKIAELRNGVSAKSDRASHEIPKKYVIEDGDFLFSWSGSLLAKFWTGGKGALNQHLFKVTSEHFPMWFVSQWVYQHLDDFRTIAASKVTTMGHIQRIHLREAIAISPPPGVLDRLGEVVQPILERIISNQLESRAVSGTRDLLLPKLVSGELHVEGVEVMLDHAL